VSETRDLPFSDLAVRPALSADLPAIMAMVRAAFGHNLEASLVERLERERRVAVSVVAAGGGRVVGHALLSRVDLIVVGEAAADGGAADGAARPALALAPVTVAPDLQGRGIGSLVGRTCVRLADPKLPVFVIGSPAFYGRFGFEPAGPHGVASRFEVPSDDFMVRPAGPPPTGRIALTLDYPAAFDDV
jgi:putative acetyltransferase